MNRIIFTVFCSVACFIATGQTFQGTLRPGSTATSVIAAIKPSANYSDKPSNILLTLAIPQSVGARPTMSVLTNSYTSLFTTVALIQTATYATDYIYLINMYTPTLTTTKNYVANTEDIIAEIAFTGNVGSLANIRLVQLPFGNATGGAGVENGNYNFYTEFANPGNPDKTNKTAMFYTATAGTVVNSPLGYDGYSSVSAGTIVFPLKWLSFNVQKQKNDALLKWEVANQINNDYFEVQAGIDPSNIKAIGKVQATTVTSYTFLHNNYTDLRGSYIYYRIKQVDKDGKASYSQVLKLNLDNKNFSFNVVQNPVTGNNLNISIESFVGNKGQLTIVDLHGKKVAQQNISWTSGSSQQLITLPTLTKGIYSVILTVDEKQYTEKFVY
jgi:hypothetical protein